MGGRCCGLLMLLMLKVTEIMSIVVNERRRCYGLVVNRFCWVEMGGLWDNQKKNITIEENNAIENCMETR